MADKKISQLTAATLPLAGTEVLPIVQSSTTDNITVNNLAAGNLKSQSTTGVLQVSGPTAGTTRVMTVPDANFTAARTDTSQTFTGTQTFANISVTPATSSSGSDYVIPWQGSTTQGAAGVLYTTTGFTFSPYNGILKTPGDASIGGPVSNTGSRTLTVYSVSDGWADVVLKNAANTHGGNIYWNNGTANTGGIFYYHAGGANYMEFTTNSVAQMRITSAGDINVNKGNLVQGTAAKGINFTANTPAAGMTSQLLNWYEEGTWTPTPQGFTNISSATLTNGKYTRVGRQVTICGTITANITTSAVLTALVLDPFPFTAAQATSISGSMTGYTNEVVGGVVGNNSTSVYCYIPATSSVVSGSNKVFAITFTYFV